MIVPSAPILWLGAAVAFPAAVIAALFPEFRIAAWVLVALLIAAAGIDAALSRRTLEGVTLELPPLLRFVQGRRAALRVQIHNDRSARTIRLGFAAPGGIALEPEDQWIQVSAHGPSAIDWDCLPSRRGTYGLDACYLEAKSPLGFWLVRRRAPVQSEIRVYPNLRDRSSLQSLRKGTEGIHTMRQLGRGRDFDKLREYTPGDSTDEIHWKATARRGRPITKVFQVERTQEVYLIVDTSRLSGRIAGDESALDKAIKAALILGSVTERKGDLFGLAAFSDRVEVFLRARSGKAHFAACRDAINDLQTRGTSPDYEEIATFLRLQLRRRSLIVFLSSLDDPVLAAHFEKATRLLARRHLVMVGMLRPSSAQPLFTQPDAGSTEDVYRALAGHLGWKKLRELQVALAREGVRLALFEPNSLNSGLVRLYDDVKQRQLL